MPSTVKVAVYKNPVVNYTAPTKNVSPHFYITTSDGKMRYLFPYAPKNVTLSNFGPDFATVDRPGKHPLLIRKGLKLPTLSFTLQLGWRNRQVSQQVYVDRINKLANSLQYVKIEYGLLARGWWRITDVTVNATDQNLKNDISRGTIDIEFTRVSDAKANLGPASGGHKPTKKTKHSAKAKTKKGSGSTKTYTVKRGDTLWSICKHHYGDPQKWHRVADYNHLKSTKLKIGKKLKLP